MSNILDSLSDRDLERLRLAVENQINAHQKFASFDQEVADELVALKDLLERLS